MTYDVAVVVVTYNKILDECLASLQKAFAETSLRVCLVVVDNGSTTFSAHEKFTTAISESVVILRDRNYGFGASCNRAVKEVDAAYYFFLNPDTELVDAQTMDRLFAFMRSNPKAGIVAPRIHHFSGEFQETCRRFPAWYMPIVQRTWISKTRFGKRYVESFLLRDTPLRSTRMIDWAQGSALFVAGDLFHVLGGFDDRFWMYFEDIDLCRRSWEHYRPVYYYPDVMLRHAYGKASSFSGHYLRNLFTNRPLRAHLASWMNYLWKWNSFSHRAVATRSYE